MTDRFYGFTLYFSDTRALMFGCVRVGAHKIETVAQTDLCKCARHGFGTR